MSVRRGLVALCGLVALLAADFGAAQPEASATRFAVVDVYVDSAEPLAAWQFELREQRGAMQVVGIEASESPSFAAPPYYDRGAVDGGAAERIVVAAFSLDAPQQLPRGRTRVATVHVRLTNVQTPIYELRLIAAGAADGRPIDAKVSLDTRTGR